MPRRIEERTVTRLILNPHIGFNLKNIFANKQALFVLFCLLFLGILSEAGFARSKPKTQLNFDDVEVGSIIKLMSKVTGRTFIYNEKEFKGKKITLLSTEEFTADEAYKIFEAVLSINGLSTIDEGKVTRIINSQVAKTTSTPIYKKGKNINQGSFVTRVIPVKNVNIRTIRSSLAPLISKHAVLVGIDSANILIIRDSKQDAQRFAEIVRIIDQEDSSDTLLNLEIIPLINADSTETAGLIERIFKEPGTPKNVDPIIRVLANKRTNDLILIGNPKTIIKIKQLVAQLDQKMDSGEGNIRVYRLKNANAEKISKVLQNVAKSLQNANRRGGKGGTPPAIVSIIPDIPSNALVIFADTSDFPTLENVIKELDVMRSQVFIQALIMEVKLDKSLDLGIEWQAGNVSTQTGIKDTAGNDIPAVTTVGGVGATGLPKTFPPTTPGGAVIGVIGGPISFGGKTFSTFNAFIKATQQDTEIDILSSPKILTLNNEPAEIKVGEIVPTLGSTKVDPNGNTTTTIDYKEVGISLKITPQINSDNSIELQIDETSSNVVEGAVGSMLNQGAITTLNRSLKTKIVVEDKQTIALGGLISDEISSIELKTPCLGSIPVLGWLFKTYSSQSRKTNLLIFLTPTVIKTAEDLNTATLKATEQINRSKSGKFRIDISKEYKMIDGKGEE
ncbi:MAG: type II secretion system secretin GspD [Deltaproteobacteria bacterium]|nr:type II secretion system secretin GspD [Deltaproteobacteria bacterium]